MAGGLTGSGERNAGNVKVRTRLIVFGQDMLTDLTGLSCRTFGKENDDLTKFLIGTFCNDKRSTKVGTQLAFEFFSLNFQTTRTDDIVFATKNAKTLVL